MKKAEKWIVLGIFAIVGLSIGVLFSLEDPSAEEDQSIEAGYLQEIEELMAINEGLRERMEGIREEIREIEENLPGENVALAGLRQEVKKYQVLSGRQALTGPGIEIQLSSARDENIALIIESRDYLVNLLNELKTFGGEAIELNGHRIVARSEVTLAGNHINVNGTPIAPPYIINVIGNQRALIQYVEYNTFIFTMMEEDGVIADIMFLDEVEISALGIERPFRFFEPME